MDKFFQMKLFLILLITATYLQSCCKGECVNGELHASFENFRAVDLDTIMLIKYQRGSQQQTIIDTAFSIRHPNPLDTFRSYHTERLFYPFDWKIVIPSINKEYIVSDFELRTIKCCGEKGKSVSAFKLNNAAQQGDYLKLQ